MVCKISGNNKRDLNFVWRFIGYVMYGPWEDHLNRHETAFYQQVAPHLKDTSFRYPKVYFAGKYLQKICFLKYVTLDILFRQITTIIKVRLAFVFGLQTL